MLIVDECDKIINNQKMCSDFKSVIASTPSSKQVLMFSDCLKPESKIIC